MMLFPDIDGPVEIVFSYQVQDKTREGWILVGMYQEQDTSAESETVPDPNDEYPGATILATKVLPKTATYFVMTKNKDKALKEATTLRAELSKAYNDLLKEKEAVSAELLAALDAKQRIEIQTDTIQTKLTKTAADATALLKDEQRKYEQLQNTFARVWQEVGNVRMREVLGSLFPGDLDLTQAQSPKTLFERLISDEET